MFSPAPPYVIVTYDRRRQQCRSGSSPCLGSPARTVSEARPARLISPSLQAGSAGCGSSRTHATFERDVAFGAVDEEPGTFACRCRRPASGGVVPRSTAIRRSIGVRHTMQPRPIPLGNSIQGHPMIVPRTSPKPRLEQEKGFHHRTQVVGNLVGRQHRDSIERPTANIWQTRSSQVPIRRGPRTPAGLPRCRRRLAPLHAPAGVPPRRSGDSAAWRRQTTHAAASLDHHRVSVRICSVPRKVRIPPDALA